MIPHTLSVIVPAYNEAARIGRTLQELCAALPAFAADWEVRVVDDGSVDTTVEVVRAASAVNPRVILQRESHRGKGAAVRAGMLAARGDFLFLCDADLSMPIAGLPRFIELAIDRFDIVIGSREGLGATRIGEPKYRHFMGRLFNTLVRGAAVPGIQDTQCGFKMFTRAAATSVFPLATIDGWAFDIEVLVIARRHGFRIHEMPIEWHHRELSRVSPVPDALRMARDVFRIRARAMRGHYDA